MLSVFRLTSILKKFQLRDITKLIILRATTFPQREIGNFSNPTSISPNSCPPTNAVSSSVPERTTTTGTTHVSIEQTEAVTISIIKNRAPPDNLQIEEISSSESNLIVLKKSAKSRRISDYSVGAECRTSNDSLIDNSLSFFVKNFGHFETISKQSVCVLKNLLKNSEKFEKMSSQEIQEPAATNACSSNDDHSEPKKCPTSKSIAASTSSTGEPSLNSGLSDIIKFLELVGSLKHIKRTGWVMRDVKDCETISGHMYRMGLMTFLLDGKEGLNKTRCMEMALVHDLAESLVGDITPFCGVSKEDKRNREIRAMEEICKLIEPRGQKILEIFLEYEANESPESKFVKDLDRLDMVLQAFEYEKRDNCITKHQEFFDSTSGKFNHPFVIEIIDEIYKQRKQLAQECGNVIINGNDGGSAQNGYPDDNHHDNQCNGDITEKKASTS